MKFLRDLSIRNKLMLISVIPLLALGYFLQGIIATELGRKQAVAEAYLNFQEVEKISSLIHELQKERGLTITYLRSKSTDDRDKMVNQRELTSNAVSELQGIYRGHQKLTYGISVLDSIPSMRDNINAVPNEFNVVKSRLMSEISNTSRSSKNSEIRNLFDAHLYLLYSKEYLSRIRGLLAGSILSKGFQQGEYGAFSSSKGQHELNLDRFRETASPELRGFFEKKTMTSAVGQVYTTMDSIYKEPDFLRQVSHDFWWVASSEAVNIFKEAEDFSLQRIKERAELELETINRAVSGSIILAALVIILIIVLVVVMIKEIVSSISRIKSAAERMTNGEVDFSVEVSSKDEVGDLAVSFNRMIGVTKEYSRIAYVIGQGEYDIQVDVRSESDTLGKALNEMRNNLRNLSRENEARTWLLTGSGELNDRMRGDKDLLPLVQDIINHLTIYLRAQVGAVYVKENDELRLVGSYAFHLRKGNASNFTLGQGFVGQAALEKKTIVFNDIPENYIKINSGLGNSVPRNIIVFPFLYENDVKGVVEIGSAREFSELDMQLLQIAGDNIAIAVNAAQSRERLKQLLEETQRQAEELETQQEELRQSNEELQAKTDMLERSEAELKSHKRMRSLRRKQTCWRNKGKSWKMQKCRLRQRPGNSNPPASTSLNFLLTCLTSFARR
jgi:nitrate/nitrite-specific signal transduction histidine kinase